MSRIFMMSFHSLFIFISQLKFSLMARLIWVRSFFQLLSCGFRSVEVDAVEGEFFYCFHSLLTYFPQKIVVTVDALRLLFLADRVFWAHFDRLVWTLEELEEDYFFYWLIRSHFRKMILFTDLTFMTCFIKFLKFSFCSFQNVSDNSVLSVLKFIIPFQTLQTQSLLPLVQVFVFTLFHYLICLFCSFFWKAFIIRRRFATKIQLICLTFTRGSGMSCCGLLICNREILPNSGSPERLFALSSELIFDYVLWGPRPFFDFFNELRKV